LNDLGDNFRVNEINFGGIATSLGGKGLRWVTNRGGNPILHQNTYTGGTYFGGLGSITVGPLSPTLFMNWATAQGLTSVHTNSSMADPDRDGLCNLPEFTLRSSPVAASVAAVPQLKFSNSGAATFEYDRSDASLSSITRVVEYSNDLSG
jgi:hypothetical protein